ncbi:hypothetical protein Q9R19_05125 [Microbacterium sp. ARD32]|uniref:hypothetical protein n=1 Tax=Microbacterium sp. ARD32 TaxID=2962577 RepID=UPI0028812D1F|nr:hypothetical protein [Microbacterium sp. ARD32]MDT0157006.1 hypothetical protein [Microbacterium sp. ARD32]
MTSPASASARAMRGIGAAAVIAGGLVAAVTGPLELTKGSWTAAYLVLVAGAAQILMGSARRRWPRARGDSAGWWQFALWNLGHAGVIGGTLTGLTTIVFCGSAVLVVALVLAFLATFGVAERSERMLLLGYRVVLVLLAVSIPVGMVLSAIRNA